ncbi:hypothetical protein RDV78_03870 [Bacillota bacterium LX-D]|nr:hypothetical protein [Bacillota bacterium LX-D]
MKINTTLNLSPVEISKIIAKVMEQTKDTVDEIVSINIWEEFGDLVYQPYCKKEIGRIKRSSE